MSQTRLPGFSQTQGPGSPPAAAPFDLVVAANRLPVARVLDTRGRPCWHPSPGGLVSAMEPVMRVRDAAWVGWAGEPGGAPHPFCEGRLYLQPVPLSVREVEQYYDGYSNSTLWPLFHDLVVPTVFHREWWNAYRRVNARFARTISEIAAPFATVWVHDYHLQLVPQMVRARRPDLRIGWFDHIPFPPVELFGELPWRRALLEGLLGADFLGFQCPADVENLVGACRRLLSVPASENHLTTTAPTGVLAPREVRVAALPISVDFTGLDTLARSPAVVAGATALRASLGNPRVLMLAVDRFDYTKGIRHRLKAYEELLRERALDAAEVVLVQAGLPTRERLEAYRALTEEVEDTVRRINHRYSSRASRAVVVSRDYCSPTQRAAMFLAADVMLVTPLRDGMNLVAKEYVACRHELGGALVLSEFAGASNELHEAYFCNPHDIDGMKQAIMSACNAPALERRRRMAALRARVREHDVQRWATDYMQALAHASGSAVHQPRKS